MRQCGGPQAAARGSSGRRRVATLRFIELMPMGPLAGNWAKYYVSAGEIRTRLEPLVHSWQALAHGAESSRDFQVMLRSGRPMTVGFITPMSCNFCSQCTRMRLGARSEIFPCLMDKPRGSVMAALRPAYDAELFDELLSAAMGRKAAEHPHDGHGVMTQIGG